MESYPRQAGALVTVVAVEEAHVVVADADSVRNRARCIPSRASREVAPLKPGDVLIVNDVNPGMGSRQSSGLTRWGSGTVPDMSCSTTSSRPSLSPRKRLGLNCPWRGRDNRPLTHYGQGQWGGCA
jgi:hypothetical protein